MCHVYFLSLRHEYLSYSRGKIFVLIAMKKKKFFYEIIFGECKMKEKYQVFHYLLYFYISVHFNRYLPSFINAVL